MATRKQYIVLTYKIAKEGDLFSAVCEELDTASCGDTLDEAIRNIAEAVYVDLTTLEKLGERSRFFRERGIRVYTYPPRSTRKMSHIGIGEFVTKQNIQVPA